MDTEDCHPLCPEYKTLIEITIRSKAGSAGNVLLYADKGNNLFSF